MTPPVSSKPTVILVHGAWHSPACFQQIITPLKERFIVHAPGRPSIGAEAATKTLDDDVRALQALVRQCVEERGEHVFVVAHSAGGYIAPAAIDGLSVAHRHKEGKNGGVLGLGLMAAFIAPENAMWFDGLDLDVAKFEFVSETTVMPKNPAQMFYNDLPAAEAQRWVEQLVPTNFGSPRTLGHEGWRDVLVWYLLCENDAAVPLRLQQGMVAKARERGAEIRTHKIASGHSPFLSQPEETVRWLERVIDEAEKEVTTEKL